MPPFDKFKDAARGAFDSAVEGIKSLELKTMVKEAINAREDKKDESRIREKSKYSEKIEDFGYKNIKQATGFDWPERETREMRAYKSHDGKIFITYSKEQLGIVKKLYGYKNKEDIERVDINKKLWEKIEKSKPTLDFVDERGEKICKFTGKKANGTFEWREKDNSTFRWRFWGEGDLTEKDFKKNLQIGRDDLRVFFGFEVDDEGWQPRRRASTGDLGLYGQPPLDGSGEPFSPFTIGALDSLRRRGSLDALNLTGDGPLSPISTDGFQQRPSGQGDGVVSPTSNGPLGVHQIQEVTDDEGEVV